VCSNKLISTGAFDQPTICPAAVTPPVTPPNTPVTGSSPGTSGAQGQSSSGENAPGQESPLNGNSPEPSLLQAPASAISNEVKTVFDTRQPLAKRLGTALVIISVLSGSGFGAWFLARYLLRLQHHTLGPSLATGLPSARLSVPTHTPGTVFHPTEVKEQKPEDHL
jgi:hypothetical protein